MHGKKNDGRDEDADDGQPGSDRRLRQRPQRRLGQNPQKLPQHGRRYEPTPDRLNSRQRSRQTSCATSPLIAAQPDIPMECGSRGTRGHGLTLAHPRTLVPPPDTVPR